MRKVRQLKDSLLGWGGYKDLQDKIYLDKKVVYMRGPRVVENGVTTEKLYLVNVDGTQSDKAFEIRIDPDSTTQNEKFFFDKRTQCIVRTAFTESGSAWGMSGVYVSKKIVFDLYDPNTLEHLDHHIIQATSSQALSNNARKENCSQGLYSFYCNGVAALSGTTPIINHPATVFVYSPRHKKVFSIPVGNIINVYPRDYNQTLDTCFNIYNESTDLDKLDNISLLMYNPGYGNNNIVRQYFFPMTVNLETNPVSVSTKTVNNCEIVGAPDIDDNAIVYKTDSSNYVRIPNLLKFKNMGFYIEFCVKFTDEFLQEGYSTDVILPESSFSSGVLLNLSYDSVNDEVVISRKYRNSNGEIVYTFSGSIPSSNVINKKIYFRWSCSLSDTVESLYYGTNLNTLRKIADSGEEPLVRDLDDDFQKYMISVDYQKFYVYLTGLRISISRPYSNVGVYTEDTTVTLPPESYRFVLRGGGGAGGENGSTVGGGAGGAGGAGGKGELKTYTYNLPTSISLDVHIGTGGLTHTNGGNGGAGGAYGSQGGPGGAGGGGAQPTYIFMNDEYILANGGGGGGGGGGGSQTANSRFACGSGGGGGGGYYRLPITSDIFLANEITVGYDDNFNLSLTPSATPNNTWTIPAGNISVGDTYTNTINNWFGFSGTTAVGVLTVTAIEGTVVTFRATQTLSTGTAEPTTGSLDILTETVSGQIESVPGKTGGRGGQGTYDAGDRGTQGNVLDFPEIYSGSGGIGGDYGGERIGGQPGANGGGASGAGGGANNKNADGSSGGRGGGGAGGSMDAGGGARGDGGFYGGASDAYNAHTTPTDTTGENAQYGITGNYGVGGTTNTNGTNGVVVIQYNSVNISFTGAYLDPMLINYNGSRALQSIDEKYPNYPFTTSMVILANNSSDATSSISYNKYSDAIPDPTQDILVENKLGYFETNWTVPADVSAKINTYTNKTSGSNSAAFTLQLSSSGWNGLGLIYATRNTNIANGNPFNLHSVSITSSVLETPTMNSSIYPRMFPAPKKIVEKPIDLSDSGEVARINDVVYTKSYSDPCIASLVITPDFIVPLIISETKAGATGYTSAHSTPGTTWKIKYNNKIYYVCFTDDAQTYSSSASITNTMNLPKLYVNIGTLGVWDFSTIQHLCTMVLDSYYREGYEVPIFIKDYYNDGVQKLVYKYRCFGKYTNIVVYDSVTGNAAATIDNELSIIPLSEQHMVLTSTSDSSGLPRYINLISTAEDTENLKISFYTNRLDCNTNTAYLADNTTSIPPLLQDGAFRIPPVAIADGELTPVDDTLPENYYAWKKASDNTIIYTNSLDPSDVVGTAYFFKDTLNNFYREVLSNISEITSLTDTYLTTRVGVEYTRLSEYDWSLKHDEQIYVPAHLKGWSA